MKTYYPDGVVAKKRKPFIEGGINEQTNYCGDPIDGSSWGM